jgi:hypothetical protein
MVRNFTVCGRNDKIQKEKADVAQLVEQLIRNQQVSGSIPLVGSRKCPDISSEIFRPRLREFLKQSPPCFVHQVWYLFIHGIFILSSCTGGQSP